MPTFGETKEELAVSFNTSIRGPSNPFADDNEKTDKHTYYAPEGYIITKVRYEERSDQGYATSVFRWEPDLSDYTLTYEQFESELRNKTGVLFDQVVSHEKLKSTYETLTQANKDPKNWARALSFENTVIAPPVDTYSARKRDYYVELMYVGNESDVGRLLDEWISGVTVVKRYSYYDYQDGLEYINTSNHSIEGDLLIVNNQGGNDELGSVFLQIGGCPSGSKSTFVANISTIGSPKTCEVVIWELEPEKEDRATSGPISVNDWKEIKVEYTTKNSGYPHRFEVYSHDNLETNTVINMSSTTATIEKTF